MFCSKCGNQINDGQASCANGGAPVNSMENQVNADGAPIPPNQQNILPVAEKPQYDFSMKSIMTAFSSEKCRNLFFALAALLVLNSIFIVLPTVQVDVMIASGAVNMFDGVEFLGVLSCIGYLASAAILFVPIITKKAWKKIFILPAKIMAFWTTGWFLLIVIVANDEVSKYHGLASFSLPITGWFLVICTVSIIIVSFVLSSELKKQKMIK